MSPPLVVEVARGPLVESIHEVHAVVATPDGPLEVRGDADRLVQPRSAVKMIQALPLVVSGAAAAFELDDAELALACASHSGEPRHLSIVRRWLDRLDLDASALECGAQRGRSAGPVANDCSGKHAGFLTVARHIGVDHRDYTAADHPVQQQVASALASVMAWDPDPGLVAVDGCGIPVYPFPLGTLATGIARFTDPPGSWDAPTAAAAAHISAAMRTESFAVGGSGRLCTELMEDVPGLIAKDGAEGVYLVGDIGGGWGAAVKAVDGAIRAAEHAVLHLLEQSGRPLSARLRQRRVLHNWTGRPVGEVTVS